MHLLAWHVDLVLKVSSPLPPTQHHCKAQRCTTVIAGSGLKPDVVRAITEELRKRLGLTLFGYDTVVQQDTGDLEWEKPHTPLYIAFAYHNLPVQFTRAACLTACCFFILSQCAEMTGKMMFAGIHFIIDVNYFPSYKEFPDAARVLSSVLKEAYFAHTIAKQSTRFAD